MAHLATNGGVLALSGPEPRSPRAAARHSFLADPTRVRFRTTIFALALALSPAAAQAAEPTPEAAPQSPSVSPDPISGGSQGSATSGRVQSRPTAPSSGTVSPSPGVQSPTSRSTGSPAPRPSPGNAAAAQKTGSAQQARGGRRRPVRHRAARRRGKPAQHAASAPGPSSLFDRSFAFVKNVSDADDSNGAGLRAGAALLALVLAGGSLLSLTARLPAGRAS